MFELTPERRAMPIMTYPGLELTGRTILQIVNDGQAQFDCIRAVAETYPSIAALTTMDLSVEAEAFGCPVAFSDAEVPAVSARIVSSAEDVANLKVPPIGSRRTAQYLKAAELTALHITDRPTLGGVIGPFSLAGRLYDFTEIMVDLLLEPAVIHALLEKCTAFLIEYIQAFKQAGADGIIMAEPAAGLLSAPQADAFSSQCIRRIVAATQDDSFTFILHNCGNTVQLVPSMLSTGAAGFHFGNAVQMTDILPQIPADKLVFGNIDPAKVLKNGSPAVVRDAVLDLLDKTAEWRNFVLSSGCDIPPGTPLENVNAFFAALDEFNKAKLTTVS